MMLCRDKSFSPGEQIRALQRKIRYLAQENKLKSFTT